MKINSADAPGIGESVGLTFAACDGINLLRSWGRCLCCLILGLPRKPGRTGPALSSQTGTLLNSFDNSALEFFAGFGGVLCDCIFTAWGEEFTQAFNGELVLVRSVESDDLDFTDGAS